MIGVLDSGLGGLSVVREILKLLPHCALSYYGDSAWCPYGSKSYPEIQGRVSEIIDLLLAQGAEIIVIACNSATIAGVEYLRSLYPVPIVGMEPGVKPAAQLTQSGTIGVLATEASLAGEKFHRLVSTHAQDIKVITQPCPEFVTLVEQGKFSGDEVEQAIRKYTEPLIKQGADTLVLGCTHYPFLKNAIKGLYPQLKIIDTGEAVAKQVERKLGNTITENGASYCFMTSGDEKHSTDLLGELCPALKGNTFINKPLSPKEKEA